MDKVRVGVVRLSAVLTGQDAILKVRHPLCPHVGS